MKGKLWESKLFQRIIWILVFGFIWQAIASSGWVNPALLPPLPEIMVSLVNSLQSGEMIRATSLSMLLIFEGLVIGFGGALLFSVLSMSCKIFQSLMDTLTVVAHPLPGIALLPIIILWMGTGANAIVFIIIHSVIWPVILNLLAGFRSIPKVYREFGRNLELSPVQSATRIMIPAALPYLLAGLKIGWARAWRALISAEMIFGAAGGEGGLGWYIFKKRVFMDSAGIYAGIIVIVIIGILVEDILFHKIEALTVKKWGIGL